MLCVFGVKSLAQLDFTDFKTATRCIFHSGPTILLFDRIKDLGTTTLWSVLISSNRPRHSDSVPGTASGHQVGPV